VDWYAIQPAIARVNGVALSRKPAHPHAAVLFYDFMLARGRRSWFRELCADQSQADSGTARTRLRFVDPAAMRTKARSGKNCTPRSSHGSRNEREALTIAVLVLERRSAGTWSETVVERPQIGSIAAPAIGPIR